jgi:hypothetical protein
MRIPVAKMNENDRNLATFHLAYDTFAPNVRDAPVGQRSDRFFEDILNGETFDITGDPRSHAFLFF